MARYTKADIQNALTSVVYEHMLEIFKKENLKIMQSQFKKGWQIFQVCIKTD